MSKTWRDSATAKVMGKVGWSMPLSDLKATRFDAIVVGAGHNGLACAAYLSRAGKRVVVLEARERVGGACTLIETWPGYKISPCAYLLGLLHPLVIEELGLVERGLAWSTSDAGMFVPFDDGESIQFWDDDARCEAEIQRVAPGDLNGWRNFLALKRRIRNALRPPDDRDVWIGRAPTREQIEERVGNDEDALGLLFRWSMVEMMERFFKDERLQTALLGQGVIGTNASPHDPGTASIHFHHNSGRLGGEPGQWGYVHGGMGMVSFLLCDVARELGVVMATSAPVARVLPGEGVELVGGDRIHAPTIISNADPRVTLRLLGDQADPAWKSKIESIPIQGCTMKVNLVLRELPNFKAKPGTFEPHHFGQINTPLTKEEWLTTHRQAKRGELPHRLWTELYFHTPHDPSIAPAGIHTMSVFAQYVPTQFAQGTWETRRDEAADVAVASIARLCSNLPDAIIQREALGPPDIEKTVGLTGGHIFQGECLPEYMWDQRLAAKTPMTGVFLCGACTHPGGSVIGVNGRNAAMEVLAGTTEP